MKHIDIVNPQFQFNQEFVLTSWLEYNKYDDKAPYIFDATGKYLMFHLGLNWFS